MQKVLLWFNGVMGEELLHLKNPFKGDATVKRLQVQFWWFQGLKRWWCGEEWLGLYLCVEGLEGG